MKKKNIIIIVAILIILSVVVGIMAFFNSGNIKEKKELQASSSIIITSGGKELSRIDMEYIVGLGEVEFSANLDTSEAGPEAHSYTGIQLIKLFDSTGIKLDEIDTIIVKAVDGYTVAFGKTEVMDNDNIYIAYKVDEKSLGTKSDGGTGPYQIIVTKDPYSQRWCKFVTEIELK